MAQEKEKKQKSFNFKNCSKSPWKKKVRDEFLFKMEEKYKIPRDKYKLYAYYARGNKPNSPLFREDLLY